MFIFKSVCKPKVGLLGNFIITLIFIVGITVSTTGLSLGYLDNSFGKDGKVVTQVSPLRDISNNVALQPDGKIVVVGTNLTDKNIYNIVVARYLANGQLDSDFGGNGIVIESIGAGNSEATDVVIQTDGKIVVVGTSNEPLQESKFIFIARFTEHGFLDSTFGIGGINRFNSNRMSVLDFATGVALQRNGRIIVAGHTNNGSNFDIILLRYNINGLLDSSFGEDGIVITDIDLKNNELSDVAIQEDGKIVVVGASQDINGFYNILVVRYSSNGDLDFTFGVNGVVKTVFTTNRTPDSVDRDDRAAAVAIQPDGKIVVAGYDYKDFIALRYTAKGTLDETFSGNGRMNTSLSPAKDEARDVLLQPDGKIIMIGKAIGSLGEDKTLGSSSMDFAVTRLNYDGSRDNKFGNSSQIMTVVGPGYDVGHGAAIQPDGKLVVAGYSKSNNYDFALVRYVIDRWDITPSFIGSIDKAGIVTEVRDIGEIVALGIDKNVIVPIRIIKAGDQVNIINSSISNPISGYVSNQGSTVNTDINIIHTTVTAGGLHAPNNSSLILGDTMSVSLDLSIGNLSSAEEDFNVQNSEKSKNLGFIFQKITFFFLLGTLILWMLWLSINIYNIKVKYKK